MGQKTLVDDLREELVREEVLVIVGSGVSIQATGGSECAKWKELILHGIEHARETNHLNDADADRLRKQLEGGRAEEWLDVAEEVSKALRAKGGGEFHRWLRKSVGQLEIKDRSILDAIHALGAPVATTNYDDLLTRGRGIAHVPWTDVAAAQEILRGDRRDTVLHLHGCIDHPQSVVLGRQSYERVLDSPGAQAVQRGIAATRTLLFVGCGDDGLSDPNLGALLEWIDAAFGSSIYRHYRLCRNHEQKAPDGRLYDIGYGADFNDLAPFLRSLAPHQPAIALPHPGYCFGREREVEEVVTALVADNPRPLPILGGPGMGKTTIALQALHDKRVAERFRERRWFVRCDGVKSRAELAAAIALAIGLPVTPSVETTVLAALASAPAALVLDNMETPLDAEGRAVGELLSILAAVAGLALVATIRGHRRPHGVPWTFDTEAERLTDSAAADVFVAVSGKRKFANDPDLPRLLVALDGVPLAITLMARYAELYDSLEPVWSRWKSKRTAMLKDGEEPDRLRNIAVSYELSIGVLGASARRLLSVLAMLPDGVAYADLGGVFADADDAADELRRCALVFDEAQRLRMRAPLREYVAAARPPATDDERKAIGHYLALAADEGAKVGAIGGADAVARLAPEVANVEAMLGRSDPSRDDAIGLAVYGWADMMRFTGLGSTAPIERIGANAAAAGLTKIAAQSSKSLGDIALDRSDHESARARYEEALRLCRQVGSVQGEASCVKGLGNIALDRSDHEGARTRYEEALPLYRQVGDVQGEAHCTRGLGDIALNRSDHESARMRYEEALPLYRQAGDVLGEANCVQGLGNIALDRSDHESARMRYEEALPLYRQVGDVEGEADCVQGLGDIALAEGRSDEAEARYRAALALYERVGEPYSIGDTHRQLARLAKDDIARTAHVKAAREAWLGIKRENLVAELDGEFLEA